MRQRRPFALRPRGTLGGAGDVGGILANSGVNDEQIVEIVAHVALNLFTNYVNVALAVPVDFPGVKLRPAR